MTPARALPWTEGLFGLDPVTRKEFYGFSRKWQTYALRTLYIAILAVVVGVTWASLGSSMSYSDFAAAGHKLVIGFMVVQAIVLSLSAVLFSTDTIGSEVRRGTLGLLAMSPMGTGRVVFGKWKACTLNSMVYLLAGLPFLSIGSYLGGVSPLVVVVGDLLTLLQTMLCAAYGMMCSALFRGYFASLAAAFGGAIGYMLVGSCCCGMSPIGSLLYWLSYRSVGGGSGTELLVLVVVQWSVSLAFCAGMTVLFLWITARKVRTLATLEAERSAPVTEERSRGGPRFGFTSWMNRTPVWEWNPFLWREMRAFVLGELRIWTALVMASPLVPIVLLALVFADLPGAEIVRVTYGWIAAFLILAGIGAGAGAFTREKESRRWEVLLCTPVTAGRLLAAKLVTALAGIAPLLAILFLYMIVTAFVRDCRFLPPIALTAPLFTLFMMVLGMYVSLRSDTSRTSGNLTMAAAMAFLVAIPSAVGVHAALNRGRGASYDLLLEPTNPFWHLQWIGASEAPNLFTLGTYFALYATLTAGALALCYFRLKRMTRSLA